MKIYYSIKEVAKAVNEPESTLRYWEDEFPEVITPTRNERGVRFYKENDIENVRMIRYLIRDRRLTLEGVRKNLKNNKDSTIKQAKIVLRLKDIRNELKLLNDAMGDVEKIDLINNP